MLRAINWLPLYVGTRDISKRLGCIQPASISKKGDKTAHGNYGGISLIDVTGQIVYFLLVL